MLGEGWVRVLEEEAVEDIYAVDVLLLFVEVWEWVSRGLRDVRKWDMETNDDIRRGCEGRM